MADHADRDPVGFRGHRRARQYRWLDSFSQSDLLGGGCPYADATQSWLLQETYQGGSDAHESGVNFTFRSIRPSA